MRRGLSFIFIIGATLAVSFLPHAVGDETSERGGVSPPVLGRKPSLEEPGG